MEEKEESQLPQCAQVTDARQQLRRLAVQLGTEVEIYPKSIAKKPILSGLECLDRAGKESTLIAVFHDEFQSTY